jgi:hypothetical protein
MPITEVWLAAVVIRVQHIKFGRFAAMRRSSSASIAQNQVALKTNIGTTASAAYRQNQCTAGITVSDPSRKAKASVTEVSVIDIPMRRMATRIRSGVGRLSSVASKAAVMMNRSSAPIPTRMKGRMAPSVVKGIPTALATPYPLTIEKMIMTIPQIPRPARPLMR